MDQQQAHMGTGSGEQPCCPTPEPIEETESQWVCASCGKVLSEGPALFSSGHPILSPDISPAWAMAGSFAACRGVLRDDGEWRATDHKASAGWLAAEARLVHLSTALRLPADLPRVALRLLLAMAQDGEATGGRETPRPPRSGTCLESRAACCLLIAARLSGEGSILTLREVAAHANCADHIVLHRWPEVLSALQRQRCLPRGTGDSELRVKPESLVERFCSILQAKACANGTGAAGGGGGGGGGGNRGTLAAALLAPMGGCRKLARELLSLARDESLLEGRNPQLVAAAAVVLAAQAFGLVPASLGRGGQKRSEPGDGGRGNGASREESAAPCTFMLATVTQLLEISQGSELSRRIHELRGTALSRVRALPGRARLSDAVLTRALPRALGEVALARRALDSAGGRLAAGCAVVEEGQATGLAACSGQGSGFEQPSDSSPSTYAPPPSSDLTPDPTLVALKAQTNGGLLGLPPAYVRAERGRSTEDGALLRGSARRSSTACLEAEVEAEVEAEKEAEKEAPAQPMAQPGPFQVLEDEPPIGEHDIPDGEMWRFVRSPTEDGES